MQTIFSANPLKKGSVSAMQRTADIMAPKQDNNIEMSLREHLLAAQAAQQQVQQGAPAQPEHIDPAISGPPSYSAMAAVDTAMTVGEALAGDNSRKGRRELSNTKRAAQNRAAQRAFRQRKEEYIKSLKDRVDELENVDQRYRNVVTENYQLRNYIIALQSKLLEIQAEIPPAPANLDLSQAPKHPSEVLAEHNALSSSAAEQLQAAAAAAQASEFSDAKDSDDGTVDNSAGFGFASS